MKKWIIAFSLVSSSFVQANSLAMVRNVLINGASHTVNYELSAPSGFAYHGALTPGQIKTIPVTGNPGMIYGTYALSMSECYWNWFSKICKSKFKTLFIQKNEDVTWIYGKEEIKATEMPLS